MDLINLGRSDCAKVTGPQVLKSGRLLQKMGGFCEETRINDFCRHLFGKNTKQTLLGNSI